jgi:N utilization substance protein A
VAVPDKQLSLAIGKEGQNARLTAKLTGWRIDIKSISALEAEKASLGKEATIEAGEAVAEVEETVPEFAAAEELPSLMPISETEAIGEKQIAEVSATPTEFELALASEVSSPAKSAESRQIRFAEDILPARTSKIKKKSGKKEAELPKGKSRPKKARSRPTSYSEEDELEG